MTDVKSYSNVVVSADQTEILDQLRCPEVMAVVWHNAWSKPALDFAQYLSRDSELTKSGKPNALCDVVAACSDQDGAKAFKSDLKNFERLLSILRMQLHFGATVNDRSRLESTSYHGLNIVPEWHVDSGHLALLSVPSGPTTEYIDGSVTGTFKDVLFKPTDPSTAMTQTRSLENSDVIIFKCRPFSKHEAQGSFIHKRPNCLDLDTIYPNRPVVHMKVS